MVKNTEIGFLRKYLKYRFDYIAFFELFGASLKDGQKYTEIPEIRFTRYFLLRLLVYLLMVLSLRNTEPGRYTYVNIIRQEHCTPSPEIENPFNFQSFLSRN